MKLETYLNAVEQEHILTSSELLEIIRAAQEESWDRAIRVPDFENPYRKRDS